MILLVFLIVTKKLLIFRCNTCYFLCGGVLVTLKRPPFVWKIANYKWVCAAGRLGEVWWSARVARLPWTLLTSLLPLLTPRALRMSTLLHILHCCTNLYDGAEIHGVSFKVIPQTVCSLLVFFTTLRYNVRNSFIGARSIMHNIYASSILKF